MYTTPLISIALCTYNGADYINEQLDSILSQTYKHLEIIIVDDASTDGTVEILKNYAQQFESITLLINQTNIGFNENFKFALKQCKGEFIAIADQDDIWMPQKIGALVEKIGSNLLIYHDSEFIDTTGNSLSLKTSTHHRFVKGDCSQHFIYYNCVSGHASLFSSRLREALEYIPEGMYYDWWLAYTAACSGKITFVNDTMVKHRKHAESSTAKDLSNPRKERIGILTHFKNHPLSHPSTVELLDKLLLEYKKDFKYFSFPLFQILNNRRDLFFIRKRSPFSQLKMIYRECLPNK